MCFKEIGIRHSFTLEATFYGRDKTEEDIESTDLHMDIDDFKLVGEDLAKVMLNFLPVAKYQRKINFLYKKFLNIIHEEALKCCLPFNQERYLKRNYRNTEMLDQDFDNSELLVPSLEELEGKPMQPELFDDNEASSEEEELKGFMPTQKLSVDQNPEVANQSVNRNESVQDLSGTQEEIEEDFAEFKNVLN